MGLELRVRVYVTTAGAEKRKVISAVPLSDHDFLTIDEGEGDFNDLKDLLTEEQNDVRQMIRRFVDKEIMPIREKLEISAIIKAGSVLKPAMAVGNKAVLDRFAAAFCRTKLNYACLSMADSTGGADTEIPLLKGRYITTTARLEGNRSARFPEGDHWQHRPQSLSCQYSGSIYGLCREAIEKEKYAPRGFMLSSGCEIPPEAPLRNIDQMHKAILDCAKEQPGLRATRAQPNA